MSSIRVPDEMIGSSPTAESIYKDASKVLCEALKLHLLMSDTPNQAEPSRLNAELSSCVPVSASILSSDGERDANTLSLFDQPIVSFDLSERTSLALVSQNIFTLSDLVQRKQIDLYKLSDLPKSGIYEIESMLSKNGVSLGMGPHVNADILDMKIDDCELTVRSSNALLGNGVSTIGQLIELSLTQLRRFPNLGTNSLKEIELLVDRLGLDLGIRPIRVGHSDSKANIVEVPSSVFDTLIESCDLSQRSINGLVGNGVLTIGDLIGYQLQELKRFPHLGTKSVFEIETLLNHFGLVMGKKYKRGAGYSVDSSPKEAKVLASGADRFESLEELILHLLPKNREGLLPRLCGENTLADTGINLGVTRERVRQLQAKYERRFRLYKSDLIHIINQLELPESETILLSMLSLYSDYFKNIHIYIPNPKSFFMELFSDVDSKYRVENIDDHMLVVRNDLPVIDDVISTIISLNIQDDYSNYLSSIGRIDLTSFIPKFLQVKEPTSVRGQLNIYVAEILDEANETVSVKKIQTILANIYKCHAAPNQITAALKRFDDVFIFSSRGWGRESKFGDFSNEEIESVAKLVIKAMTEQALDEYHLDSILREITFPELLNDRLDTYQLNWILSKVSKKEQLLVNKGRFVWGYGGHTKRQHLLQVAIEILHAHGAPMSNLDLKNAIDSQRGVSRRFQLRPSRTYPDLVLTDDNKWGLRDRDLAHISQSLEDQFVKGILGRFKVGIHTLDTMQLREIMVEIGLDKRATFFECSRLLLRYTSQINSNRTGLMNVKISPDSQDQVVVTAPGQI
ncbi:hypothetical protein OAU08_02570 [Porticoccaceae bacterium]|nr:hypothetical protein [Porticoccaceae bacterium]